MKTHPTAGFWAKLPKPIIGLAPMDGVTDQPFRYIQKKYGQPAVMYTEFTSVEGLCRGADQLLRDFLFDEAQRPIVAQIYGTTPEFFRQAAIVLGQLGFDGIDINMGCPAKNVAHSGAGAALIQTPKRAREIIRATQQGVRDWQNGATARDCANITDQIASEIETRHQALPETYQQPRTLPVTVKTRVGYDQPIPADWTHTLLETEPVAIAFHGRTLKQQYSGQANWEQIAIAAEIINQTNTLVFGNGDITSHQMALDFAKTYQLDGILIGRGSFGSPEVFQPTSHPSHQLNKFEIALEHAHLFEQTYNSHPCYNFLPMRKHLGWYCKGVDHAKQVRIELFKTNSPAEVKAVLEEFSLV